MNSDRDTDLKHWKTKKQFLSEHQQFNLNQLNWLIRHRHLNGFEKAFKKIGRSIYIHEPHFATCIAEMDDR